MWYAPSLRHLYKDRVSTKITRDSAGWSSRAARSEPPLSSRPTASSSIAAQRQRGPAAVEPGAAAARPPVHAPVEALTVQY